MNVIVVAAAGQLEIIPEVVTLLINLRRFRATTQSQAYFASLPYESLNASI